MAGSKGVPAHYQERPTKAGQHKLEVAIRIPSLYGAEWVDEHRQLHKDGSCKCAGDFSFYKSPEPSQSPSSSDTAQLEPSTPSHRHKVGTATTPKPPPLVVSSSYPHVHAPLRSPGAIYEVDPTKSTNKLYNFACGEGANMASLADFQSVEFPRAVGTLPLVGLPIGAGPEGAPDLSHVGSFEDCVLHTRNLIACMGDEPTAGSCPPRASRQQQQQQGLPARERSQSASSSAESPDYEDSGAEEDQPYFS
ncbi:hypothetical protein INS49_008002 [Diaporthe citri]|uniref:uncharacterized protein n=1 Tax=Diaporthe citri TaxID=83186 RepID=UPI001C7EC6A8|nr:uncharacterized protein INS49_008002 [Diaporthe citri]KAG6362907.1 hypothetical protein INS49_008002 [Diaporthe citri]